MAMKDVIVTGGSGFIGRSLSVHLSPLVERGRKVLALSSRDVDLVNREATFQWFERNQSAHEVSHIFHLAAVYKAGGWPATHPATQFHANMAINVNLLEAWKRFFPGARLTNVVSYCMYPDHDRPHPETELYGTEPEEYLFAYAFTKKALLIGQRAYCQEFGLSAVGLVLPTVYGPGDSFMEESHVMGALIGKFCRAAKEGRESVEVWGDGTAIRSYTYVDDMVDGIRRLMQSDLEGPANIGAPEYVSVKQLVETTVGLSGKRLSVKWIEGPVGVRSRNFSNSRIYSTGWTARFSLRDGIERTYPWVEEQVRAANQRRGQPPQVGEGASAQTSQSRRGTRRMKS